MNVEKSLLAFDQSMKDRLHPFTASPPAVLPLHVFGFS